MPPTRETATTFVLMTLQKYPDNELQIADVHAECGGRYTKENLANSLNRLMAKGLVSKATETDRRAWWAITAAGLAARG